jgi:hypothetical protein
MFQLSQILSIGVALMISLLSRSLVPPIILSRRVAAITRLLSVAAASTKSVPVEIPLTDTREYAILTLKNSLRCVVVSDPTSEKSAAALVLRAGAALDPPDMPGMAHFTEHMVGIIN